MATRPFFNSVNQLLFNNFELQNSSVKAFSIPNSLKAILLLLITNSLIIRGFTILSEKDGYRRLMGIPTKNKIQEFSEKMEKLFWFYYRDFWWRFCIGVTFGRRSDENIKKLLLEGWDKPGSEKDKYRSMVSEAIAKRAKFAAKKRKEKELLQ